jgi:LytS/YehU family sensor histidine kinase
MFCASQNEFNWEQQQHYNDAALGLLESNVNVTTEKLFNALNTVANYIDVKVGIVKL